MKQNIPDRTNKKTEEKSKDKNARRVFKRGKKNLTLGMIRIIVLCLLVPYLSLSVVLFFYTTAKTEKRINDTVITSIENAAEICEINIETAISDSKKASYDGVIKRSYNDFLNTGDESKMYNEVSSYLKSEYKYSSSVSSVILLFDTNTKREYYTYNNQAGATYSNIRYFKLKAEPLIMSVAKDLETKTALITVENHLYVVRNIVSSNYTPFATIIMEMNTEQMFKSMDNVVWKQSGLIYIDDRRLEPEREENKSDKEELNEYAAYNVLGRGRVSQNEIISRFDMDKAIATLVMKVNGQKISYIAKLDKEAILSERGAFIYVFILLLIISIPLMYATIRYFYTNISKPISKLMTASEKIESGKYGYKLKPFNRNTEFGKLFDTFNHMSGSLEDSFNRIYAEEVALRDANMKALQSQINPHFLNNTLEIINWKARMSGNDDVSEMIESLGIMMEATMNRKNESFITIREEMKYVDAYLYIIVQRFGEKFQFEQQIDEDILDLEIPRLIVQPLVENMVEHGGDKYGNRKGNLKIFKEDGYLHIVVENNGDIKAEDAKKIKELLDSENMSKDRHNIGIRNVNLRLKMLYGENSGLIITNPKKNLTISEIVIEEKKLGKN